jgi:hypothetical protein
VTILIYLCLSCMSWICVCIVLLLSPNNLSDMSRMNASPDGSLCVYPSSLVTRPYGLYDPLCISGETFLDLGRGLICRCSGVFVGQLWMNPGSKLPNIKKDSLLFQSHPNPLNLLFISKTLSNLSILTFLFWVKEVNLLFISKTLFSLSILTFI